MTKPDQIFIQSVDQDFLVSQLLIYAQELHSIYLSSKSQAFQLNEANRKLNELDTTKSNFVQLVSHELRTPVAVVAGYIEILTEMLESRLEGVERKFLHMVNQQTEQLSKLVQQLTEYTRFISEGLPVQLPSADEDNDLSNILRCELEDVKATMSKNLDVQTEISQVIHQANIEPTRFRLIVKYLLNNAVKFNVEGGWIKVKLQIEQQASAKNQTENELPGYENETQNLVLRIGNSGTVIPPDKLNVIFDSFRQVEEVTRRHQGGFGIGLTIVGRAVASLSGKVKVSSDQYGTYFTITLPYHPWENPEHLKQKLQEMQSLALIYAQDLRQLYNVEREKREKFARVNRRLNIVLSAMLTVTPSNHLVFSPDRSNLDIFEEAIDSYVTALAKSQEIDLALEVSSDAPEKLATVQNSLIQALLTFAFDFIVSILDEISTFPNKSSVHIKVDKVEEKLTVHLQRLEKKASPELAVSKEVETQKLSKGLLDKLTNQLEILEGSCSFEYSQNQNFVVTIVIPLD